MLTEVSLVELLQSTQNQARSQTSDNRGCFLLEI